MIKAKIEDGYRVSIPEPLRKSLKVGDELSIDVDQAGRIVLIPESRVREALGKTAGMWRDRQDIPADGVEYVNRLRQARRLAKQQGIADESD